MMNEELRRYVPIVDMIAKMFGKNCEVVLHDLSKPLSSVVYAANNHVTGRQIGQTFDHLIKEVLLSKDFANDYKANYLIDTPQKKIKSSTVLLRSREDKVIGALCINYDVTRLLQFRDILSDFIIAGKETVTEGIVPFDHVVEIVDDLIDKIIGTVDVSLLKRRDKIELIRFMEQKGVFLIKGSVEKVADKLNISKVTVYSYLDALKKEEKA